MPYRVEANKSDDEHAPDWRTEASGLTSVAAAEEIKRILEASARFSEVIVVGYNGDEEQWN